MDHFTTPYPTKQALQGQMEQTRQMLLEMFSQAGLSVTGLVQLHAPTVKTKKVYWSFEMKRTGLSLWHAAYLLESLFCDDVEITSLIARGYQAFYVTLATSVKATEELPS